MAKQNGWFAKKDKTDLVEGDGFQQSALEYPGLSKDEIFESLEKFYRRYYFNKFGKLLIPRKPSWRIFGSMLKDKDVFKRRAREGASSSRACRSAAPISPLRRARASQCRPRNSFTHFDSNRRSQVTCANAGSHFYFY